MIFIAISLVLFQLCLAAKLDNSYLPPAGAAQSGGGPGLSTPGFGGGGSRPGGGNNALGGTGRAGPGQGPSASRPSAPNRPSGGAPAAPSGPPIEIISFESENNGDGSYKFSYESANGIKAEEQGEVKNKGSDNEIQSVQGSYSYTSPEGQLISVTYVADENGFVAQGDHLPTPVPLPQELIDAIAAAEAAHNAAAAEGRGPNDNGGGGGGGGGGGSNPSGRPASSGGASRPASGGASRPSSSPSGGFPAARPGGGSSYSPDSGYTY